MIKKNMSMIVATLCITQCALGMAMEGQTEQRPVDIELFNSISHCHVHRTSRMLKAGANPNACHNGFTALEWCTCFGNERIRELLIEYGAKPDLISPASNAPQKEEKKEQQPQSTNFVHNVLMRLSRRTQ